jgi:hypothetical protein
MEGITKPPRFKNRCLQKFMRWRNIISIRVIILLIRVNKYFFVSTSDKKLNVSFC